MLTYNQHTLPRFTFKKKERLSRKKYIQELFNNGSSFFLYPFKVFYLPHNEEGTPTQWLISVPKKLHKTAVARNLIKRRVREAYRLHKNQINLSSGKSLFIAYIYVSNEILPYEEIENKLNLSFVRLNKEIWNKYYDEV